MKRKEKVIFKRKENVVSKVVGGKAFLLNLETGDYFEVNSTGLAVWNLCDGRRTIEEIVLRIAQNGSPSLEGARQHVCDFVKLLKRYKLILLTKTAKA